MNREAVLECYEAAIASAGLERKGKTMPYTSSNGYMYSQLNKANEVGVRLSKEDTTSFDVMYGATPFMSYGARMREYVLVPEVLLQDTKTLSKLLQQGYEYVNTLPPK